MRFTIRDVLWLTLVAALMFGWILDRWHVRTATRALTEELVATQVLLRESGGIAEYRQGKWIVGDDTGNYVELNRHGALP